MTADRFIAVSFVVVFLLGCMIATARGHDPYTDWRKPDNPAVSCCNGDDCRPTRAYVGEDGLWRAWNGAEWLVVPREVMLPPDYAGDGRSHICERGSFIYCFTPGQVRG